MLHACGLLFVVTGSWPDVSFQTFGTLALLVGGTCSPGPLHPPLSILRAHDCSWGPACDWYRADFIACVPSLPHGPLVLC